MPKYPSIIYHGTCWINRFADLVALQSFTQYIVHNTESSLRSCYFNIMLLQELGGHAEQSSLLLALALKVHLHSHLTSLLDG